MSFCVLIPAYQPDETLIDLTHEIISLGTKHIVIVNDGCEGQSLAMDCGRLVGVEPA